MICQADEDNAKKHCECVINRAGLGRGGEHLFLHWTGGSWDFFFNGLDITWTMLKTCSDQCMLLFCDRSLYCLCPFFSFGYYFMFGGLCRDNYDPVVHDFMFPHLHSMLRENVARRMTRAVRQHIDTSALALEEGRKRVKCFLSKSMRIGSMTENRVNQELDIEEEYERSGHIHPSLTVNPHAEGYIGSCPAKNAPAGLAMAGYKNPHVIYDPYSFASLLHVFDAVQRLIQKLFKIDVVALKRDGKFAPVVTTAAARVIGAYNELRRDHGPKNGIVQRIERAGMHAKIEDCKVPQTGSDRHYLEVLTHWSSAITLDFETRNNKKLVTHNGQVNTSLDAVTSRVDGVQRELKDMRSMFGELITSLHKRDTEDVLRDRLSIMEGKYNDAMLRKELYKNQVIGYKHQLNQLQLSGQVLSPLTPPTLKRQRTNSPPPIREVTKPRGSNETLVLGPIPDWTKHAMAHQGSNFPPTSPQHHFKSDIESAKKSDGPVMVAKKNVQLQYSGTIPKKTTAGFTIRSKLLRMYNKGIFAGEDGVVLHRSMLMVTNHERRIPVPNTFPDQSRYRNAFKCVAISIMDSQFNKLGEGGMTTEEVTKLAIAVSNQVCIKMMGLESEYNLRNANLKGRDKSKDTINAYGKRFLLVYKAMVKMVGEAKAKQTIEKHSALGKGGGGKSQTLLGDVFPSAKKAKKTSVVE